MAASKRKSTAESPGATIPLLPLRDGAIFPGVIHTLHIVRESTKRAVRAAIDGDGKVLCIAQRDSRIEDPSLSDLHGVGVECELLQASPLPDGSLRAILRALRRAERVESAVRSGVMIARAVALSDDGTEAEEIEALKRECVSRFQLLIESGTTIPAECAAMLAHADSPSAAADLIAYHLALPLQKRQAILEQLDVMARLRSILAEVAYESRLIAIQRDVARKVDSAFGETQREFYLREQIRAIRNELGEAEELSEVEHWRKRVEAANLPTAPRERAEEQLEKLERTPSTSPEAVGIRDYLDWIVALPWNTAQSPNVNLQEAERILDERHYGIRSVKERILEYLAVRKLTDGLRGPILCFVGPPGVGKSSAAASIADAMGRKLVRIALGGLRDEAEIRGHRRTYVGAMPGRILKELRTAGTSNPVILLDEIDKLSRDWRGDPAGALLEALDPMMNESFVDHFLELPFNLRDVVFVATANTVDGILPALHDRLEIVEFSSYDQEERSQILRRHLLPQKLGEHGLSRGQLSIDESALDLLVDEYSWEPGVRQLAQKVAALCRKGAKRLAEGGSAPIRVTPVEVRDWLGAPLAPESAPNIGREGSCLGLAVSALGGMAMPIEACVLEPNGPQPSILITGNAGDVMRESAHASITFLRKNLVKLGIEGGVGKDVHIHVGEGALPKDGPSAGLPMALALLSGAARQPIPASVAASGEIGIHGDVRPVGGVREKLIAARREGIRLVLLPSRNEPDVAELPASLWFGIEIKYVSTIEEAWRLVWETWESDARDSREAPGSSKRSQAKRMPN